MTTLLLVRHGETDWNADGRLQGHTDRPLSDYGRRQARQLADQLKDEELEDEELEAIYSSDLARARETAEIVGERLGLPVVLEQAARRPVFVLRRVAAARAVERRDVLERDEDVAVQLDVGDLVDVAVCGEDALLVIAAEERDLDLLALVLARVVLHRGSV